MAYYPPSIMEGTRLWHSISKQASHFINGVISYNQHHTLSSISCASEAKKRPIQGWVTLPGSVLSSLELVQILSPLICLTSVFGMSTGVSTSLSPPDLFEVVPSKLNNSWLVSLWLSPRPISISQLHVSLHFHLWPIYLVVFKGSYFVWRMGDLILE